jgi:5-methylcytosine-specific restriction endonuclease McrA
MFRFLINLFTAKPFEARSPQWSRERAAWLADHPSCEACGGREAVEVHHVLPISFGGPELDHRNFMTLCESPQRLCHFRIGHSCLWAARNAHAREDAAMSLKRIKERITR